MGFPGVDSSTQKSAVRKQPRWLPARPVETSDLLSGPQELLLPQEEEGGWEEGKPQGGTVGENKELSGKKKLAVRNQGEWEDLNGTVRGSLVLAVVVSLVCL